MRTAIYCALAALAVSSAAATAAAARQLPLLRRASHAGDATLLGASYAGDTLPPPGSPARNATDALHAALVARGARLAQLEMSWSTLEPAPGVYDFQALAGLLLTARQRGGIPLFTLNAIDTNAVKVPSDLADPADSTRLRPGLAWNDSLVVTRYADALLVAAPLVLAYGGFYFGVGNEVDSNLAAHPETADAFVAFVASARAVIQGAASPDLAVGVTLTLPGLLRLAPPHTPPWLATLLVTADATPLNFYPLNETDLSVLPLSSVPDTVAAAIALLPPGAPVIFQEFGVPAGFNNASSVDGSSLAFQAAFVDSMAAVFKAHGVRAASLFMLVDWNEATCEAVAQYYVPGANWLNAPALMEYLCTLGVVDAKGKPKPAFDRLLAAAAAAR